MTTAGAGLLVTGANGFIGRALVAEASARGRWKVRAATRSGDIEGMPGADVRRVGELSATTDWRAALDGIDAVVHSAARVHVLNETASDPLGEFRRANVEGTLALAQQAAEAGVRRFVFLSSIGVNGIQTMPDRPFTAGDVPRPVGGYAVSKFEAEQGLRELAEASGLEVVIIRPVVVYGPGVKGNMLSMLNWLNRGIPLPFGAIPNKRSLLGLSNLVDLTLVTVDHPAAGGHIFLASDGVDLSTAELLRRTAASLGRRPIIVPVHESILRFGTRAFRKPDLARRLLGSLHVDIEATRTRLGWEPPVAVDEELRRMAQHYLAQRR